MKTLYFDLDGVLRDLETAIWGGRVDSWEQNVRGVEFFEYMKDKLDLVLGAKPTEYYEVVRDFYGQTGLILNVLTKQPDTWKPFTEAWMKQWFGTVGITYKLIYVTDFQGKESYLNEDSWLIDDYPGLIGKPYVIGVDKTYNKDVECKHRLSSPKQLELLLRLFEFNGSSLPMDDIIVLSGETAIIKGWWESPRTDGEIMALIHSEVSECLEELRKPEINVDLVAEELADVIIRIGDFACSRGLDLDAALKKKMFKNLFRKHKHGKRF